eukprot:6459635-Amphidinium_carterae.1
MSLLAAEASEHSEVGQPLAQVCCSARTRSHVTSLENTVDRAGTMTSEHVHGNPADTSSPATA